MNHYGHNPKTLNDKYRQSVALMSDPMSGPMSGHGPHIQVLGSVLAGHRETLVIGTNSTSHCPSDRELVIQVAQVRYDGKSLLDLIG
jgi:hypothetical protein